ncbi:hypothetical protein [Metabacillus bambusae]|uniref:Uncharacterized protein n=1 Tax=Metabacillus bambusae TaxID=2795218 RepID=A0ABS3MYY8_9BACI|nr:hypothetical protein [Metabacillus bambusae]MBO1511252.1 hypothetical protein [Metabacillus bambusae]
MWVIAGILLVAILIIVLEVPPLWEKQKKESWVFSLLLLFEVGLSIAESLDLNIPNPLEWIAIIY